MPSITDGIDSLLLLFRCQLVFQLLLLPLEKLELINSALFAISILAGKYPEINRKLKKYRGNFEKKVPIKTLLNHSGQFFPLDVNYRSKFNRSFLLKKVKDNNVEQALRVLKRKLQREGFFLKLLR